MTKSVKTLFLIFPCIITLLLSGCLSPQELYLGNKVETEQVALVRGVPQSGTWQTFDLNIAYNYLTTAENIDISGQAELGDHQKMVYDRVRSLDIYLFFLDPEARVLLTEPLNRTFGGTTDQKMTFKRSYKIPSGTVALSFGYSGKVEELDSQMYFYQLPLKK